MYGIKRNNCSPNVRRRWWNSEFPWPLIITLATCASWRMNPAIIDPEQRATGPSVPPRPLPAMVAPTSTDRSSSRVTCRGFCNTREEDFHNSSSIQYLPPTVHNLHRQQQRLHTITERLSTTMMMKTCSY